MLGNNKNANGVKEKFKKCLKKTHLIQKIFVRLRNGKSPPAKSSLYGAMPHIGHGFWCIFAFNPAPRMSLSPDEHNGVIA